jgi:hypothetical protein
MAGDEVLAQLSELTSPTAFDASVDVEEMAELQRLEVNLVGDRQRDQFNTFVKRKDELDLLLLRARERRVRFRGLTLEVLMASRKRMLEAAGEDEPPCKPDGAA